MSMNRIDCDRANASKLVHACETLALGSMCPKMPSDQCFPSSKATETTRAIVQSNSVSNFDAFALNRQMDEIILRSMVFFGTHGVTPDETAIGQRFGVDVTLRLDLEAAGQSDDLADSVSYSG